MDRVPSQSGSLTIERQAQVSWFDTRQLLATAAQSFTAQVVGSMTGRRELIAALEPGECRHFDFSDPDEIWLDYVADTGDGWNATTSVAWLVGRDGIVLGAPGERVAQPIPSDCYTEGMPPAGPGKETLPGGALLVLGGDQVYPAASPERYQNRFIDPLQCARWYSEPPRKLFPIPGNHDWYDGLTSFIRLFCRSEHSRRWFGCWQASQRRSYYALRLPHRWWLWGIDTALEDDLDPQQHDYFYEQAKKLEDGDGLILVVPSPVWLDRAAVNGAAPEGRFPGAEKLEVIMALPKQVGKTVEVPLILTGDLHYYARHEARLGEKTRHYIVCGGGGAFTLGTLATPATIALPDETGAPHLADLAKAFPDNQQSKRLRWGVLGFLTKNPGFSAMLAAIQLITLWLLNNAGLGLGTATGVLSGSEPPGAFVAEELLKLMSSPALVLWLLALLAGFGAFASSARSPGSGVAPALAWGLGHGSLQLAGGPLCVWLAYGLVTLAGAADQPGVIASSVVLAIAAGLLFLYCGTLFGVYLFLSNCWARLHGQEVFSAQAIVDFRSFLRLRINRDGLTIWPVGLERSAREWRGARGVGLATTSTGVFAKRQQVSIPAGAQRVVDPCEPLAPHLIEPAIIIPPRD